VGDGKYTPRRHISVHLASESGHCGVIAVEWRVGTSDRMSKPRKFQVLTIR
jgi:hypothetical protein